MSSTKKECVACKSLGKICNQDCVFSHIFRTDEDPDYKILDTAYGIEDVIQSVNKISHKDSRGTTLVWLLGLAKHGVRCKLFSSPLTMCSNVVDEDPYGPPPASTDYDATADCHWIISGQSISLGEPYPSVVFYNRKDMPRPIPPLFGDFSTVSQQQPPATPKDLQYGQQVLPFTRGVVPPATPLDLQYGQQQLPFTRGVAPPATPQDLQYGQQQLPFTRGVAPSATPQDLQYGQQQLPFKRGVAPSATPQDLKYSQQQLPFTRDVAPPATPQDLQYGQKQLPFTRGVAPSATPQDLQYGQQQLPFTLGVVPPVILQDLRYCQQYLPFTHGVVPPVTLQDLQYGQQSAQTREQNKQQNEEQAPSRTGLRIRRNLRVNKSNFK